MRIGILGGTFSPPHFGHLILAQEAMEKAGLSKVIFIPCGNPPHKDMEQVIDANLRFEMVRRAIENAPNFEISDIEINSEGKSYTAKTLEKLRNIYKNDTLCFIVGADSLCNIDRWYHPQEIFDNAEVVAAYRSGLDLTEFSKAVLHCEKDYGARITTVEMMVDISSSDIRERVKKGKSVSDMLPERVFEYIEEMGIYKEQE